MDHPNLTDGDLAQLAKEEQQRQIRLKALADACDRIICDVETELAERALYRKAITYGDLVTVRFKDGVRDFKYEGLDCFHWSNRTRVRLRAFTTKGKPYKQADSYQPSIIASMTRKDNANG